MNVFVHEFQFRSIWICAGLIVCVSRCFADGFPPTTVSPVADGVQVAVAFPGNTLGPHDNQVIPARVEAPSLIGYRECAHRWQLRAPTGAWIVESPQEAMARRGYFYMAHPRLAALAGDTIWLWNDFDHDTGWSLKLVTGYYRPSGADDSRLIIACKHASSAEAMAGAVNGMTSPTDDDDNPVIFGEPTGGVIH